MVGSSTTTPLRNCWLWIARYSPALPVVPKAWQRFVLWQYTDGNAGMQPHQVPGIGRCDRDKFDGDEVTLRQLWGGGSLGQEGVSSPVGSTAGAPTAGGSGKKKAAGARGPQP